MSKDGVLSPACADGESADAFAKEEDFSALKGALERLEMRMIYAAHKKYGSSYKVAKALGISQTSAHRKIRKYCGQE